MVLQSTFLNAEVLIPLENATAIVGGEGYFFCQLQGNKEKLRIGGSVYSLPHYYSPNNFNITVTEVPTENSTRINNITIIITAQIKYNNTEVECYDRTMGRENASKATLIIQGSYCCMLSVLARVQLNWRVFPTPIVVPHTNTESKFT